MIVADAETVHKVLDYPRLIEALRAAHREDVSPGVRVDVMAEPEGTNVFVSLLAWQPRKAIVAKLIGVFPSNVARDPPQPSVQGLVALFDSETGKPLLIGDGAALTFRKTAADSALGADYLARKDASTLLVAGAGGLAPHVIEAHMAIRPSIDRVLIWNRTPSRAKALAERLHGLAASIEVVENIDAALPSADIVSCVTMAKMPVVKGALLKRGAHVDLIGAYAPDMREADDEVARRAGEVFVDTRENCEGSGEISQPIARGLISHDRIVADLFDLATGRHRGRTSDSAITMYKNVGGGHLDLYTAQCLLRRLGV